MNILKAALISEIAKQCYIITTTTNYTAEFYYQADKNRLVVEFWREYNRFKNADWWRKISLKFEDSIEDLKRLLERLIQIKRSATPLKKEQQPNP